MLGKDADRTIGRGDAHRGYTIRVRSAIRGNYFQEKIHIFIRLFRYSFILLFNFINRPYHVKCLFRFAVVLAFEYL